MKTEMQVLEKLQAILATQINEHLDARGEDTLAEITQNHVSIDFPDVDRLRHTIMFFIQPDYENLTQLSMGSDLATLQVTVFILCKGASSQKLIQQVFSYYTAFYLLVRSNQTLDGFIDFAHITDMDYYPAVTASATITAIEVGLQLQWSKDF